MEKAGSIGTVKLDKGILLSSLRSLLPRKYDHPTEIQLRNFISTELKLYKGDGGNERDGNVEPTAHTASSRCVDLMLTRGRVS